MAELGLDLVFFFANRVAIISVSVSKATPSTPATPKETSIMQLPQKLKAPFPHLDKLLVGKAVVDVGPPRDGTMHACFAPRNFVFIFVIEKFCFPNECVAPLQRRRLTAVYPSALSVEGSTRKEGSECCCLTNQIEVQICLHFGL